jgi:hypothetical protein
MLAELALVTPSPYVSLVVYHGEAIVAKKELRFHIEGTTPHTIPMARLAEYLAQLAVLMGNKQHVHFLRVETGSLPCIVEVDEQSEDHIISRVKRAAISKGPKEAIKANTALKAMLKQDEFSAEFKTDKGETFASYPLIKERGEETFGPFKQDGFLDGMVVRLGGIDETLPVHLVYEGRTYICNAGKEIVRQLGPHIWGEPIRVHGEGKWYRNAQGRWELQFFDIQKFEPLQATTLADAVTALRAIPDNGLLSLRDPLGEMRKIRHGE